MISCFSRHRAIGLPILLAAGCSSGSSPGTSPADAGIAGVNPTALPMDPGGTCTASVHTRLLWTYADPVDCGIATPVAMGNALLVASTYGYRQLDPATGEIKLDLPSTIHSDLSGFVVTRSGIAVLGLSGILALRASDGVELWRVSDYGGHLAVGPDDTVYVTGGVLHPLDPASGKERWSYPVSTKWPSPEAFQSFVSPIFIDPPGFDDAGHVFVLNRGGNDIVVQALDATSGNLVWTSPIYYGGAQDSTAYPAPVFVQGKVVVVLRSGSDLTPTGVQSTLTAIALDAATGSETERVVVAGGQVSDVQADPSGTVVIATDTTISGVRASDGAVLWQINALADQRFAATNVAVVGNVAYASVPGNPGTGRLMAIDVMTGATLWTFDTPASLQLSSDLVPAGVAAIDATSVAFPKANYLFALNTSPGAVDRSTLACDPCGESCLDAKWLGRCAPDGSTWRRLESCSDACMGNACVTCTAHASQGCNQGDVYWFDSCGRAQELAKDCGSDACKDNVCVTCTAHASQGCNRGDVYWFDSCGRAQELAKDCGSGTCTSGACVQPHSFCDCTCLCSGCLSKTQKSCSPASTDCGSCAPICEARCQQSDCGPLVSSSGSCQ